MVYQEKRNSVMGEGILAACGGEMRREVPVKAGTGVMRVTERGNRKEGVLCG